MSIEPIFQLIALAAVVGLGVVAWRSESAARRDLEAVRDSLVRYERAADHPSSAPTMSAGLYGALRDVNPHLPGPDAVQDCVLRLPAGGVATAYVTVYLTDDTPMALRRFRLTPTDGSAS